MWEVDDDLIYLYSLEEDGNDERRYPPQENNIALEFRDLTFDEPDNI